MKADNLTNIRLFEYGELVFANCKNESKKLALIEFIKAWQKSTGNEFLVNLIKWANKEGEIKLQVNYDSFDVEEDGIRFGWGTDWSCKNSQTCNSENHNLTFYLWAPRGQRKDNQEIQFELKNLNLFMGRDWEEIGSWIWWNKESGTFLFRFENEVDSN